jgi:hypothetical protein
MEVILFTEGPDMLFIRAENTEEMAKQLNNFNLAEYFAPQQAFSEASRTNTIVFVTEANKAKTRIEDAIHTFVAPWGSDITITNLFNNGILNDATRIDLGPGIIFLKAISNKHITALKDKLMNELYSHKFMFVKGVEVGEVQDTIVYVTTESLSRPVSIKLDEEVILVHRDKYLTSTFLEKNIVKIFMETISEDTLKELGITIYDHHNLYDLQRQRIYTVITDLSLGFIVGERFTTDSPRFLMKIIVYLIKLLTPEDIQKIKWYMMGLEFLENGERICDIDVLHKGKKISWRDLDGIDHTGRKEHIALQAREELLALLSEEARLQLSRLDEEIAQKIRALSE